MRKQIYLGVILILPLLLENCISLTIRPIPVPEHLIDLICLCTDIKEGPDRLEPVDSRTEFSLDVDEVKCFVCLRNISQRIILRWKWYRPDQKLERDTGDFAVNPEEAYLEVVTAYDRLNLRGRNIPKLEGEWVVTLFVNNQLAAKKSFSIVNNRAL